MYNPHTMLQSTPQHLAFTHMIFEDVTPFISIEHKTHTPAIICISSISYPHMIIITDKFYPTLSRGTPTVQHSSSRPFPSCCSSYFPL